MLWRIIKVDDNNYLMGIVKKEDSSYANLLGRYLLNKKVFINENIFLENNYYESCIKIKSKKELVTTEFSLPINCNNSQLFCYKPIISDLYRKILYSDFYYRAPNISAIEDMAKIIVEQFIQLIKSESNPAGLKVFVEH